jgi:uncharacterized membrane protein YoaK (UPF0700 family)
MNGASREGVSDAAVEDVEIGVASGPDNESTVTTSVSEGPSSPAKDEPELAPQPPVTFAPITKSPGRIDEAHPLSSIALAGGLLCLNSGWVNAVAFRGFDGGVTHVTGTSTAVGLNLATRETYPFLRSTAKLLAFMFGAMISGGYLGRSRLFRGGPRYAQLLILVSLALFAAFAAEKAEQNFAGALFLSIGSGVQNALTTLYSGGVMRTTHVTGTVTDMGVEIGMVLFQKDKSGCWKLKIYTALLLCYIFGGFLGAVCFDPEAISGPGFVRAEAVAVLVPATVTMLAAGAWLLFLHRAAAPDPRGYGFLAEVSWRKPSASEKAPPVLTRRRSVTMLGMRES